MRRLVLATALLLSACAERPGDRPLVIGYPVGLQSVDPYDDSHEEFGSAILANVYEGLVQVDPDLRIRPALAESWHSPDELQWVFRLRPGVRLHDGSALTAAHVVASVRRALQDPWMRGELEPVTDVSAHGDAEVVFRTRARFGALPSRLTYLQITGEPPADGAPAAGTGPYRIRSWSPERTVLESFGDYRGGTPPIALVEFHTIPDPHERARLVRSGALDLTLDVLPADRTALAEAPGVQVVARPGLRVLFLGMACRPAAESARSPFDDRRVREAVALSIDKDALVAHALGGLGERADQLPRPGEVGFEPDLTRRAPDRERARALLAAAGHPDGLDVPLDYMPGKYLAIEAVVDALVEQLAGGGIRVRKRPLTPAELMDRVKSRTTSFYLLGWLNETGSAQETYASLLATPGAGAGATNGTGWSSAEFDALLAAAEAEPDPAVAGELLRRATRLIDAELPVVPLYGQSDLYAFADRLEFEPSLFRRIHAASLRFRE